MRSIVLIALFAALAGAAVACSEPTTVATTETETADRSDAPATAVDAWNRLLAAHARDGGLDYAAIAADPSDLQTFLDSLGPTDPSALGEPEQLAFWMNAYNAVTARFVLDRYPGIESVKDVKGFFDQQTFPVAGSEMTLDAIEGKARELDARSHFAVVCASTSCPDLRGDAYRGERVEEQLDEQARRFLADEDKGLRYDESANKLWLSSIFKWYAGDFTGGSTVVAFFSRGGLVDYVLPFLPDELAKKIEANDPKVSYLDYDWSLNDRP